MRFLIFLLLLSNFSWATDDATNPEFVKLFELLKKSKPISYPNDIGTINCDFRKLSTNQSNGKYFDEQELKFNSRLSGRILNIDWTPPSDFLPERTNVKGEITESEVLSFVLKEAKYGSYKLKQGSEKTVSFCFGEVPVEESPDKREIFLEVSVKQTTEDQAKNKELLSNPTLKKSVCYPREENKDDSNVYIALAIGVCVDS